MTEKQETREVYVLVEFKDSDGQVRQVGDTFKAAYRTDRQRRRVNEMVSRGFLTLDVESAQKHAAKKKG